MLLNLVRSETSPVYLAYIFMGHLKFFIFFVASNIVILGEFPTMYELTGAEFSCGQHAGGGVCACVEVINALT